MIPAVLRIQVGILEMIAAIEPSREFLQSFKEMSTYKKSASLDELKVSKNFEKPQINNPYSQNPGVKTPRNIDAVPDNGDDPNDVPLDGGVLVLGLAGFALGIRKKK
jgi:hypothetical protein